MDSRILSGSGQYTFPPINIVASASKSWPLFVNEWKLQAQVNEYFGTLFWTYDADNFSVYVENPQKKPKLEITSIDKPPGTIAVGEATVAKVNVKYSNLATNTNVDIKISETTRTISTATVRISGTGQLTKSFTLTPTRSGDWNLKATVSSTGVTTVEKSFTIKVVQPTPPQVQMTVVWPPGTLAVKEQAPVRITIRYQNLAPGTKLTAYVNDEDAHTQIGSKISPALSGSGTYTFPDIVIKAPTHAGAWHLAAGINNYSATRLAKTITIV